MNPILTVRMLPAYGQIVIKDDVIVTDSPDWSGFAGHEAVVASSQEVDVITIPEEWGTVEVTIATEEAPGGFQTVYQGQLNVSSGRIAVTIPDSPLPGETDWLAHVTPGFHDVVVAVAGGEQGADKVWMKIGSP